jgi:hypothetical protein
LLYAGKINGVCFFKLKLKFLLYFKGLLEELVDVLELTEPQLMEIRAAALRTLTAIIHLDRNPNFPKLNTIIDVTGAALYHGFLPVLVRSCIASLTGQHTEQDMIPFPLPLATALFSFLYHLASYEAGGEALVACGMMESLLRVVSWPGSELEHITFVTRAVRVIDLITNLDMHAFQVKFENIHIKKCLILLIQTIVFRHMEDSRFLLIVWNLKLMPVGRSSRMKFARQSAQLLPVTQA